MKKEFNNVELVGWILFYTSIVIFLLLLMAEPTFDDKPTPKSYDIIALVWFGSLISSVLLIIIGNKLNKTHKTK